MPDEIELENIILQSIRRMEKITLDDLAKKNDISKEKVKTIINKLIADEQVERFETSRGIYYIAVEGVTYGQLGKMGSEINKLVYRAQDDIENVHDQIKILENGINKVYVDFISLMSIFVSIFSLIVVNANIIFKITEQNIEKFIWNVVVVNLSVSGCIVLLVLLIRLIVLKPIKRNKSNKI